MNTQHLERDDYERWNDFCSASDDAWFRHTTHRLEYILAYDPQSQPRSNSFMITNDGNIIAILPVVIETIDGVNEISCGGGFGAAPAFSNDITANQRKRVMKRIFKELDEISERNNVVRARLQIPPLSRRYLDGRVTYNYLTRFGFIDTSISTRVISLARPLETIRSEMRKGHRHSIRDATELFEGEVYHSGNITYEDFERYKRCHIKDAGEQTRPDETFEMMYEWITDDNAFLVGASHGGEFVGFSFFTAFNQGVYYGSSARDPDSDLFHEPIGHFLQWVAIKWMLNQGYENYEVGWQKFCTTPPHLSSEKEQNISYFKRGFGGTTWTLYRGAKFYDPEFYQDIATARMERYVEVLDADS